MSQTTTDTEEKTESSKGSSDEVSHYIDQRHDHGHTDRAYLFGEEVVALCGQKFIPTKNPYGRKVCPECIDVLGDMSTGV